MHLLLLAALAGSPVFDPVIVRPSTYTLDGGPSSGVVRASDISATLPIVATYDGGAGVNISFPLYQTSAALTLYLGLDGGSDATSNPCTSPATPCLTVAGINVRVPEHIRHTTTVNVAAETRTDSLVLNNFILESSASTPSAFFNVTCAAQATFTPDAGTGSGTFTAVASSSTDYSVLTDSTQGWATNNLLGSFLNIAGVKYPILENTPTTISIPNTLSPVPSVGAAYTITRPSTIFSTGANTPAVIGALYNGPGVGPRIQVTDCGFESTSNFGLVLGGSVPVQFTSSRIVSGSSNSAFSSANSNRASLRFSRSYVEGRSPAVYSDSISNGTIFNVTLFQLNVYPASATSAFSFAVVKNAIGDGAFYMNGGPGSVIGGTVFVKCGDGVSTGTGMFGMLMQGTIGEQATLFGGAQGTSARNGVTLDNFIVKGCRQPLIVTGADVALNVTGTVNITSDSFAGNQSLQLYQGARVSFYAEPLISGSAYFANVDGDTYTAAEFASLADRTITRMDRLTYLHSPLDAGSGTCCNCSNSTNYFTNSQRFDNASWTKGQNISTIPVVTVSDGSATYTDPAGGFTAQRVQFFDCAIGNAQSILYELAPVPAGSTVGSWYAKSFSGASQQVSVSSIDSAAVVGAGSVTVYTVGATWQLLSNVGSNGTGSIYVIIGCNNGNPYVGHTNTGAADLLLWNGQAEQGTTPTCPILTTSTTVSRTGACSPLVCL